MEMLRRSLQVNKIIPGFECMRIRKKERIVIAHRENHFE